MSENRPSFVIVWWMDSWYSKRPWIPSPLPVSLTYMNKWNYNTTIQTIQLSGLFFYKLSFISLYEQAGDGSNMQLRSNSWLKVGANVQCVVNVCVNEKRTTNKTCIKDQCSLFNCIFKILTVCLIEHCVYLMKITPNIVIIFPWASCCNYNAQSDRYLLLFCWYFS